MAELFNLPNKYAREKVRQSLWENISWLERELCRIFNLKEVTEALLKEFSKDFNLEVCEEAPQDAIELAEELREEMTSEETLLEDTGRKHHLIKIREGVYVPRY